MSDRCGPYDAEAEAKKWLAACHDALVARDEARAERDLAYSVISKLQPVWSPAGQYDEGATFDGFAVDDDRFTSDEWALVERLTQETQT